MKFRKSIFVTLLTFVMLFCSVTTANAETHPIMAYVKVVNTLNVRKGPSTNQKVVSKLYPGDLVTVIETFDNGWTKVKTEDGVDGYVSSAYIVIPDVDANKYKIISSAVITAKKSSKNRNFNMARACEAIDGIVLDVGEEFNWYGDKERGIDAVVGNANKENGYKQANVISGGKYVLGYGGGVCQVSTGLYNCINKIGIKPIEHHHHSLDSSYVAKGMDATVSYPNKNFVFCNTCDYPIMIQAYTDGSQVVIVAYEVLK